ncbi:hypothetical protein MYSTI_01023 [Myxococcus stipitatus DSM 14675]|uniref:Lipoprotein n=1 Tax=Myxococcus stipitatus (strain DSM 14675 / JCM 12634 / Mx s8) TaxID=1278073 RepID=L7U484_MYXSD|nr:hypothetical protein [Myxococcus stipitatus]AGC42372.1 hypothetical protein MYSTI_01023 [Myxococcus stipitatus DSM 14675]
MQSLIQKLALVSLLGATACGAPHDLNGDLSSETGSTEQEINGTEVTLPICDPNTYPADWYCWLDYNKQTRCPEGPAPSTYWLRPRYASTYVHADSLRGVRAVKTGSMSWGFEDGLVKTEAVYCDRSTNTYQASTWARHTNIGGEQPQRVAGLTSVVDRPHGGLVRGTVLATYDEYYCLAAGACSDAASLILVLSKRDPTVSSSWTEVVRRELPITRWASVGAFEVTEVIEHEMQVDFEVYVRNTPAAATEVVIHDLRLFTEKCIPDMTNPGQCLP